MTQKLLDVFMIGRPQNVLDQRGCDPSGHFDGSTHHWKLQVNYLIYRGLLGLLSAHSKVPQCNHDTVDRG